MIKNNNYLIRLYSLVCGFSAPGLQRPGAHTLCVGICGYCFRALCSVPLNLVSVLIIFTSLYFLRVHDSMFPFIAL